MDTARRLEPGLYGYEDLSIGDYFDTSGIMVTEAHVVAFAGISGDHFDVHMDEEYAQSEGFPGRIAHGLLGLSMADGLKNRSPVRLKGIASLGWNWSFRGPILIGDRIQVRVSVKEKRMTRRPERGIVTLRFEVSNQRGEIVQDGDTLLLTACAVADAVADAG
ncbi:MaoC family dehydratase [Acuticoccus kandeliae]|uniref:MaoC family dehydratase n=1 Tax=Acuticoccus kandeliae TaxID=2073160 RepID=UPI000D3E9686|nr:MaoC/PaaZ C-terminal domain-containing protein [Acuticoccus kandeliae]